MWLIYRLACLVSWHNWWDAGEGELVCLDCGRFYATPPAQGVPASVTRIMSNTDNRQFSRTLQS
jgi:hypothetical protein